MKFLRPGYTESTLQFIHYALNFKDKIVNHTESELIKWLYTTSGFYDTDFSGSYFNFDTKAIAKSDNYNKFIIEYREALMYADKLQLMLHKICKDKDLINNFALSFQAKEQLNWFNYKSWYHILTNKNVLLINSFAPLMEKQYLSGNLSKIDPNFPVLSNIQSYRTPYTLLNNGPDKNFFETLDRVKQDISSINFDIAIIAFGSYAVLLSDYCHKLGKTGISIGSRMHNMWGVDPKMKDNPLFISKLPDEYIPEYWYKIEKGGYWK